MNEISPKKKVEIKITISSVNDKLTLSLPLDYPLHISQVYNLILENLKKNAHL